MYIPSDWIKNKNNEPEIRNLISKCVGCLHFGDIDETLADVENRLKELDEDIVLKELKKGTFAM
ncbi:MAG: hypothetical protein U0M70_06615 [Eubacteriales bacterium]